MRHRSKSHGFNRRQGPKVALLRGLVYNLVENGRIKTTLAKAKELRRHVEPAITLAKKGTLHSRRLLLSRFPNENVVQILAEDLGKRFASRDGGYTRIIKVGRRAGDMAPTAYIEFVDYNPKEKAKDTEAKATSKKASKKAAAEAETAGKTSAKKALKSSTVGKAKKARKSQSSARKQTRTRKKV